MVRCICGLWLANMLCHFHVLTHNSHSSHTAAFFAGMQFRNNVLLHTILYCAVRTQVECNSMEQMLSKILLFIGWNAHIRNNSHLPEFHFMEYRYLAIPFEKFNQCALIICSWYIRSFVCSITSMNTLKNMFSFVHCNLATVAVISGRENCLFVSS